MLKLIKSNPFGLINSILLLTIFFVAVETRQVALEAKQSAYSAVYAFQANVLVQDNNAAEIRDEIDNLKNIFELSGCSDPLLGISNLRKRNEQWKLQKNSLSNFVHQSKNI